MLDIQSLIFTGGEVKRTGHHVPRSVDVKVKINEIDKKEENLVMLDFTYSIDYNPDIGMVKIHGKAYCSDTPANIKDMIQKYEKTNIFPEEYGARVVNMINANAGMNSIFLIRPFNLLPPFTPPPIASEQAVAKPVAKPKKSKSKKSKKKKKK